MDTTPVAAAAVKMVSRGDAVEMIMRQTGCSLQQAEETLQAVEASKVPQHIKAMQQEPEVVLESTAKIERRITIRNMTGSVGRNDKCPCGSGKKFKKCCMGERLTKEVVKEKLIVEDADVARQLRKYQKAGKTIRTTPR